jgi:hypothetical protein
MKFVKMKIAMIWIRDRKENFFFHMYSRTIGPCLQDLIMQNKDPGFKVVLKFEIIDLHGQ